MAIDPAGREGRKYNGADLDDEDEKRRGYAKDPESEDEELSARIQEFTDWDDATIDFRENQERCRDFYDGFQWDQEEVDVMVSEGRPIITKNRIAPKINFILGTEADTRNDPRAFPRTAQHELDSQAVTDALRYQADEDEFDSKRSEVARDLFIEGGPCGGVFGIDTESLEIEFTQVPWDRIFYDPHARNPDFSDARYMGIVVWMYRDEMEDMYPDAVDVISNTWSYIGNGQTTDDTPSRWWDNSDKRAKAFETYYRKPIIEERNGRRSFRGYEWYQCKWTIGGFLERPAPVEFVDHKGRSWNPMWLTRAYRTRDGWLYSPVQNMLSPQEELNRRSTRSLHAAHSVRVIGERGAIRSPEEFQAQLMKPDGYAEVEPGRANDGSIKIIENSEMTATQLGLMQEAKLEIDATGPQAPLIGNDQRVRSGRAELARENAGSKELKPVFDHLRVWSIGAYRRYWWLIRQYWTEEKWFRVTDDDESTGYRFVAINRRMTKAERIEELIERGTDPKEAVSHVLGPIGRRLLKGAESEIQKMQAMAQQSGQQAPPLDPLQLVLESATAREEYTANDVAQLDVDLVLDAAQDNIIVQHEQYQELVHFLSTAAAPLFQLNPDRILGAVKMLIEAGSLRDKAKLMKVLEGPPPDPQQMAAQAQQAQAQQQAQAMELQLMAGNLAKLEATVAKLQAEAAEKMAKAQVGVPSEAQLDQAQAALAVAKSQAVPQEARLEIIGAPTGLRQQAPSANADMATGITEL